VGTAHSRDIIHRDLKPANIFLSERGTEHRVVKVVDFGIAKWVAQRPDGVGLRTQTGSFCKGKDTKILVAQKDSRRRAKFLE
jgi:serine/threonine protein kinase